MLDTIFRGLFDTETTRTVSPAQFFLCLGCSLLIGLLIAIFYKCKTKTTQSFLITLAILPAVVCIVIMMVNGNVGAGVAVAGAFSLVRFRSAPGTAREIGVIFLAMGSGLIAGMGYLAYSFLFAIIIAIMYIIYTQLSKGLFKKEAMDKTLRITIPEDLDYTNVFDSIFSVYTKKCELIYVKTTNLGSLYRLTYNITLKDKEQEKAMIDELRCKNGNLEISISQQEILNNEL